MLVRRFLFAGLLGLIATPSIAEEAFGVRLLSPAPGDRLEGGELARIEWSADRSPEPFTEWEAFLSVDGGRSFPIRLTPHLDLGLHGFTFEAPNVPTDDARILLRFGDERTERILEIPTRFSIAPSGTRDRWSVESAAEPFALSFESGESARPGDRGVVVWLEGDREGRGLRPRVRIPRRSTYGEARAAKSGWLLAVGPQSGPPRLAAPASSASADPPKARLFPLPPALHPASVPIRLATHRFNE